MHSIAIESILKKTPHRIGGLEPTMVCQDGDVTRVLFEAVRRWPKSGVEIEYVGRKRRQNVVDDVNSWMEHHLGRKRQVRALPYEVLNFRLSRGASAKVRELAEKKAVAINVMLQTILVSAVKGKAKAAPETVDERYGSTVHRVKMLSHHVQQIRAQAEEAGQPLWKWVSGAVLSY